MIKKMAGAAVGTLLIASMLTGSVCIAGAVTNTAVAPAAAAPEAIAAPAPAEADPYSAYLFVHFVGSESSANEEQIYFSVSQDGTTWNTLNNNRPILMSNVGEQGVRDPHIIRGQDGKFYIVATDLSIYHRGGWSAPQNPQTTGSQNIIVWEGNSLTEWSEARAIDVGTSYRALDVWAPETIWDNVQNKYMVFWASIIGDKEAGTTDWIYRVYRSYTEDFQTFTPAEVYIERKDSTIDTTFYYDEENETYYRFSKTEGGNHNWVYMERGDSIDGAFEMVSSYRVDGKHYTEMGGYEGPTLYKLNGQEKICLLLDHYGTNAGYAPYETEDIDSGVFTPGSAFNFNGVKFRHGSVIPITQSEYTALTTAYAANDKTTGEKIFELDFEQENATPSTGAYTATVNGNITYTEGAKAGSKAALISGNGNYIDLDPTLFAGKSNLTLSFIVKKNGNNGNQWVFYAAPNTNAQDNSHVKYLGVLWKSDGSGLIDCERFYDGRDADPDAYSQMAGDGTWFYLTVVYYRGSTKVFVNGQLLSGDGNRSQTVASHDLVDTLGASPVAYLGRANWGNGEYSNITLDAFRVYDYAMPDSEVLELYNTDSATT